jgi:hypothetical protein
MDNVRYFQILQILTRMSIGTMDVLVIGDVCLFLKLLYVELKNASFCNLLRFC